MKARTETPNKSDRREETHHETWREKDEGTRRAKSLNSTGADVEDEVELVGLSEAESTKMYFDEVGRLLYSGYCSRHGDAPARLTYFSHLPDWQTSVNLTGFTHLHILFIFIFIILFFTSSCMFRRLLQDIY